MNPRCSAYEHGRQCRARKNLEPFVVSTSSLAAPTYRIPAAVVAPLCPKHRERIDYSKEAAK